MFFARSVLLLCALPVAVFCSDREIRTSPFDRAIPQIALGGGWQTTINILNMDAGDVSFRLVFRTAEGQPWTVPLEGRGSASSFPLTIRRGQTLTLATGDKAELDQGWARIEVDCCFALAGFAIFRQRVSGRADFEAVVPFTRPANSSYLIYDNTAGFTTGMSISNGYSGTPSPLLVRIRDVDGNQIASRTLNLPPDGRIVGGLPVLLAETAGRKGSLEISSTGSFSVLGLRFADAGAFTSFNSFEPQ